MTAPLVPPHVDLRDFPYMPLEVVRLRDSDLAALASDGAFRAAVILWCAAWHQVPAASLPDDDRMLARLAGFGREIDAWLAVKDEAMRNFVRCDDGRLYHTTISEKALEAWEAKRRQRERTEAARQAKLSQKQGGDSRRKQKNSVTESVTGSKGREGKGIDIATAAKAAAAGPPPLDVEDFRMRCIKAAGDDWRAGFGKIRALAEAGVSIEDRILPVIRTVAAELRQQRKTVTSWGWFAQAITDEDRRAEPAEPTAETVWCPISSPEFAAGNRARARRGEAPYRGIPSRHQAGEKGAYHLKSDLAEGAT